MDLCKYVIKLFGKPNNIIDAEIIKNNRIVEEQNKIHVNCVCLCNFEQNLDFLFWHTVSFASSLAQYHLLLHLSKTIL